MDMLDRLAICFTVIGVIFGVLWYVRWINTPTDYPLTKTGRFYGHPDDWSDEVWNDYCDVLAAKRFWRRLMFWRTESPLVRFFMFLGVIVGAALAVWR